MIGGTKHFTMNLFDSPVPGLTALFYGQIDIFIKETYLNIYFFSLQIDVNLEHLVLADTTYTIAVTDIGDSPDVFPVNQNWLLL